MFEIAGSLIRTNNEIMEPSRRLARDQERTSAGLSAPALWKWKVVHWCAGWDSDSIFPAGVVGLESRRRLHIEV